MFSYGVPRIITLLTAITLMRVVTQRRPLQPHVVKFLPASDAMCPAEGFGGGVPHAAVCHYYSKQYRGARSCFLEVPRRPDPTRVYICFPPPGCPRSLEARMHTWRKFGTRQATASSLCCDSLGPVV